MATQTLTTSTFMNPPKAVHAGLNSVAGSFNSVSNFASVGDTLFLCKIPHGAQIVSFEEDHSSGASTCVFQSGLSTGGPNGQATLSAFVSAGIQNVVNRAQAGSIPLNVSNSDLDPNRFGILSMTATAASATSTTSIIVNWRVTYRTDGVP